MAATNQLDLSNPDPAKLARLRAGPKTLAPSTTDGISMKELVAMRDTIPPDIIAVAESRIEQGVTYYFDGKVYVDFEICSDDPLNDGTMLHILDGVLVAVVHCTRHERSGEVHFYKDSIHQRTEFVGSHEKKDEVHIFEFGKIVRKEFGADHPVHAGQHHHYESGRVHHVSYEPYHKNFGAVYYMMGEDDESYRPRKIHYTGSHKYAGQIDVLEDDADDFDRRTQNTYRTEFCEGHPSFGEMHYFRFGSKKRKMLRKEFAPHHDRHGLTEYYDGDGQKVAIKFGPQRKEFEYLVGPCADGGRLLFLPPQGGGGEPHTFQFLEENGGRVVRSRERDA